MNTAAVAAALALTMTIACVSRAAAQAPAPAAAAAKPSVKTSRIAEIVANGKARVVLEKALPEISAYYEQISEMTLTEVMPMSQGAITEAKLVEIQAEFDKL